MNPKASSILPMANLHVAISNEPTRIQINHHPDKDTFKPLIKTSFSDKRRRRQNSSYVEINDDEDEINDSEEVRSPRTITRLRLASRWLVRFLALSLYSLLILPGLAQVAFHYFFSSRVLRGIPFGDQPRNRLDLYLPKDIGTSTRPRPVVAFITGGAWIIGNKAWGSLLGKQLAERGILVACIDYRNFPQSTIGDMVKDASQGISFVFDNIAKYGGDPDRIYLIGQSAGAHIAACALLDRAIEESGEVENSSWSVPRVNAYFGLSGGYNLINLADHFHTRGLNRSLFLSIMEGEQSLQRFSPEIVVQGPRVRDAVALLPPIVLFHGTGDYSIPSDSSKSFVDALRKAGAKAELVLYEGRTHTDIFVQDPMRGEGDKMFDDLVAYIHAGDSEAIANDAVAPPRKRLVPEFMLKLASRISPF